jgi:hypothetical protein
MGLTPLPTSNTVATGQERGPRPVGPARIATSIEALSLSGFPPMNTARLQSAFVTELTRLIHERAASDASWIPPRSDRLPALRLQFTSVPTAATLGQRLARAVFQRMTSSPEDRP